MRSPRPRRAGPNRSRHLRPVVVTGGAGFVGVNVVRRFLETGRRVILLDNLSRPGVERNLERLLADFDHGIRVEIADVRDERPVRQAVACADRVYHFAAQVAVTTSLADPSTDFEVNAQGTLNVLEAMRRLPQPPPMLFTSTNKVYGELRGMRLAAQPQRYAPVNAAHAAYGTSEDQLLDFHSPYGCSKGTADQYVLDYARCYRLPTVVFRMSCIYGPHQWGCEDQGWVAHFLLQTLRGETITIFGDGRQVRDVLYIDDLVDAMFLALEGIGQTAGRAFNIGGGPANSCSLLELLQVIEQIHGEPPDVRFSTWRPGDQRYYVSDIRAIGAATGWQPRVRLREGLPRLYHWLQQQPGMVQPEVTA